MFSVLRSLFREMLQDGSDSGTVDTPSIQLAMACLLCEVANADYQEDPREETAKIHLLSHLLDLDEQAATALLQQAHQKSKASVSLYEFTNQLRALSPNERFQLIEAMWQIAYADGVINPMEEAVIRQVADLIYVEHAEFIRAKLSAQQSSSTS
nr:TerB family tellurite resistance protein [uncultured Tolumonas sp.]